MANNGSAWGKAVVSKTQYVFGNFVKTTKKSTQMRAFLFVVKRLRLSAKVAVVKPAAVRRYLLLFLSLRYTKLSVLLGALGAFRMLLFSLGETTTWRPPPCPSLSVVT